MYLANNVPFHRFLQTERVGEMGVKKSATATMSETHRNLATCESIQFLNKDQRKNNGLYKNQENPRIKPHPQSFPSTHVQTRMMQAEFNYSQGSDGNAELVSKLS